METTQRPSIEVVINSQSRKFGNSSRRALQPLSVDQALQYTPLTTSVLSASDRIPLPQITRARQHAPITTPTERKSIRKALAQHPSHEVKERLEYLLEGAALAEIKFKRPPSSQLESQFRSSPSGHKSNPSDRQLSSTAKMVLDMSQIEYRYPTPISPSSRGTPTSKSRTQSQRRQQTDSPDVLARNEHSFQGNRTTSTPGFVIEIPSHPSSQKERYETSPGSPKRRKLEAEMKSEGVSLHTIAQREIADSSLLQFQNLLVELFEAQDLLDPHSLSSIPQNSNFFELPDDENETETRVSTEILEKLQAGLKQLVGYKRLNDISFDHLRRLQQLCEPSLQASQSLNLKAEAGGGDEDLSLWRSRLLRADNSALAACTVLWSLLGPPNEEELAVEDLIKLVPMVLVNIFENCLIPVVESRPDGRDAELFVWATESKDILRKLLESSRKLLDLVATVCEQVKEAELAINAVEFLAAKLIFVENAPTEKSSILGTQSYEKVRKTAMGALAKIYAKFPKERGAILDEILTSLDKLPSTSRSARQFKLPEGKNIQLITALVLHLVQTSTLKTLDQSAVKQPNVLEQHQRNSSESEDDDSDGSARGGVRAKGGNESKTPLEKLQGTVSRLFDNGARSARDIINFLVKKASMTTKTGDEPYRNLLDLFVEDLFNVLPLTDWPASELLLRILASRMIDFARTEKTASAKNMALEILGGMASTISNLKASVSSLASSVSRDEETKASLTLRKLVDEQAFGGIRIEDLIAISGPFRLTYQYLQDRHDESLRFRSARGFLLTQWAKVLCVSLSSKLADGDSQYDGETARLVDLLLEQINEISPSRLSERRSAISTNEAHLAYILTILNLGFCRRFGDMLKTLVASFSSDQAQVRSRSLKSVVAILETDSTLLDRDPTITDDIFMCASDDSAMVRDSALSLVAKFVVTRPALEEKGIRRLLECAGDSKVGVQKRAIGHLKEIYMRDSRPALKAAIAETILRRTRDHEETVAELALRTLSEMWITPNLSTSSAKDSATAKVNIRNLAEILVQTVSRNPEELTPVLEAFLASVTKDSKTSDQILDLCTRIVSELFDRVISEESEVLEGAPEGSDHAFLLTLRVFAKETSRTITPEQLRALRRYLTHLTKPEDFLRFKPVVAIFRCVLPHLSSTQKPLLQEIQTDLMQTIAKLRRRADLDEVMACLWTVDGVLKNTEKLIRLTASVLKPIVEAPGPVPVEKQISFLRIIGSIGKQWDLEQYSLSFKQKLQKWKGNSLASFMTDAIYPFAGSGFPIALRLTALESLGSICQAWPGQFKKEAVWKTFWYVFRDGPTDPAGQTSSSELQNVALAAFQGLLNAREGSKEGSKGEKSKGEVQAIEKFGGDLKTRDHDSAVGQIAQQFLDQILRVAITQQDEKALIATKVIASINRQGLVHPKQCVGAIIALETSTDTRIAQEAFASHKLMHQQHESTYEREYLQAIKEAFLYQKSALGDSTGATRLPYRAKLSLCFEVINHSTSKYVKKFLTNLVSGIKFELDKLDVSQHLPEHLLLSRFISHNLAFFDYGKLDELLHTIYQIENVFGRSAADVVQAIEATLPPSTSIEQTTHLDPFNETSNSNSEITVSARTIDPNVIVTPQPSGTFSAHTIDPVLLKRLATASTILTVLWETRNYLKRQYGISQDIRAAMNQHKQSKDASKPPLKVHGISGDRFWQSTLSMMSSVENTDAMLARCREFNQLMTVDDEVKVTADEDGMRELNSASLDVDDTTGGFRGGSLTPGGGGKGSRKRRNTGSMGGTPSKKKRGRSSFKNNRRSSVSSGGEDPDADFEG